MREGEAHAKDQTRDKHALSYYMVAVASAEVRRDYALFLLETSP